MHHPTPARPGRNATRTGTAAAIAALSLLVSACGSSDDAAGGQQPSEPAYDTAAVGAGAAWLGDQVKGGVVHNDQYDTDDYGLSIDVALALHEVGEQPDVVRGVADRLAGNLDGYVAPGYGTLTSAGGAAKALVLAETVGEDPTSFGGKDLLATLEDTVADKGPATGRVQDELDTKVENAADYANVVAQAYAVTALAGADSDEAGAATDFLLQQQCSDGWFRLSFTADPTAADQGCDGDKSSAPDLDATAFAVRALADSDDPAAQDAVDKAVTWLEDVQAGDGSFGGKPVGQAANSNSTGLAGWVLAENDATDAAEKAATWVADHQLGDCAKGGAADLGAIAYDDASLGTATTKGITVKAQDQFRRATAQALPVLQWLPSGASASGDESC